MKLDAQFTAKNNALFFLDGSPLSLDSCPCIDALSCTGDALPQGDAPLCIVRLPWAQVGMDEESYNEEFLAQLRDWLKMLENKKQYALMLPVSDAAVSDAQKDDFCASMNHAARRIKDCTSVVGFAIPQGFSTSDAESFMALLAKKHGHYVYFSQDQGLLSQNAQVVKY